ncbi:MAG: hypothetical protein IPO48_20005 [Saprospiraceae bacterium]|nr:hypothetical protein [Saprospiraceae bacterium]
MEQHNILTTNRRSIAFDVFNTERFNQEITDLLEKEIKLIQSKDYDKNKNRSTIEIY